VNIALVILHADPARGGAERYTLDLAAALPQRGHAVSLIASSFASPAAAAAAAGLRQVPLVTSGLTRAGRYRQFLGALDAHLAAESYDIIHAMLPVRRCDVYHPHAGLALAAAQRTGWNILFNPRRRLMANVEQSLLNASTPPIVISLSQYVKRDIVQHYPQLPAERLKTLFNAVDLDRFKPMPPTGAIRNRITGGGLVGLFIGRDYIRKGLAEAVAATSKLGDDAPALAVLGPMEWRRFELTPQRHTRVVQFPMVDDPRPYYADADFFVLPTKHDPCSLVVLEALAMGLPVISTRFNGATEIMTDGVQGFIQQDPTDVDALAASMRKMLDPARRSAMKEACLALRSALSYEHHLDTLEQIYTAARASGGRSG
jgi:UDP-glucose:(heptosyl)LPS alpha-1,3-glucosyltransferase